MNWIQVDTLHPRWGTPSGPLFPLQQRSIWALNRLRVWWRAWKKLVSCNPPASGPTRGASSHDAHVVKLRVYA